MKFSEVIMNQEEIDGYIEIGKTVRSGQQPNELLEKLVRSGAISTTRQKSNGMTWADGFAMLFLFAVVFFIGYLLK